VLVVQVKEAMDTFLYSPLYNKFKEKEKKRKLNNDLAILSSHDKQPKSNL